MRTDTDWTRLKRLAEQQRDACARRLADAIARAAEAGRKLDLLLEYHQEYLQRMGSARRGGMPSDRLRNFQGFLANLERALAQQREAVAAVQGDIAQAQAAWTAGQRSVDSYQVLVDRQVTAASVRDRREQQKQQDEFAMRPLPRFLTGAD